MKDVHKPYTDIKPRLVLSSNKTTFSLHLLRWQLQP